MLRLRLKNYQSWDEAHVDVEGLTVLVGSSCLGKSSIGRALKRCLRNDVPSGHIKLGTPKTEIDLEWQGLDVHVERGAKSKDSTVYRIGEATYEKLGGTVPPEIQALNIGPVEVNGVSIDPIFAGQFDSQFMVGSSPSELNAVLKAFASTEKLDRGRKVLGQRISEINASAKTLTPVISGLEEQEHALEEKLVIGDEAVQVSQALHTRVQRLTKAHEAAGRGCSAARRLLSLRPQVQKIESLTQHLATTLRSYKTLILSQRKAVTASTLVSLRQQVLGARDTREALACSETLLRGLRASIFLRSCREKLLACSSQVNAVKGIPEALASSLTRYKSLVRVNAYLASDPAPRRAILRDIHSIDLTVAKRLLLADTISRKAVGFLLRLTQARSDVAQATEDFTEASQEVSGIEQALQSARLAQELITCPKCGHEFTLEHQEHA